MPVELKVPVVGESITEVQIGQWLKGEGDRVEKDENVVELESDKATVELPAPVAGAITKVLKQQGERAAIGEVIALLETSAPADGEKKPKPAKKPKAESATTSEAAQPAVAPSARRALREHGLSAEEVQASGPGGRLLKEDVLRHVAEQEAPSEEPPANPASPLAPKTPSAPAPRPAEAEARRLTPWTPSEVRQEEVVPMTPIRRRIAERLVEAQRNAALLTTFNEIDMSPVVALRQQHREAYEKRYGIKLGFMSFFVKAAVDALKLYPQINAEVRGEEIVYRNYADIGIAIGSGKGLVVPVLRDAERLSFAQVELAIADFAARAQKNQLKLSELQGGTFTISNGGVYGSLLSTPIVNPPQSGILGMHTIQDRPIALAGQVVIRPMMYVALTYDHRVVDGREAVSFLKRIKDLLEDPSRMLLEV